MSMVKNCHHCMYFELQGDVYHTVEHCTLHDINQKSATDHLEVCDDWKQKTIFHGLYKAIAIIKKKTFMGRD